MTSHDIDLDERVYAILRNPVTCSPAWIRIVMLQARMTAEGASVMRASYLVYVWNATTRRVEAGAIDHSASRRYEITEYFDDEFDVPDWTRVIAICDIDGTDRATVTVDPAGPPPSDYVSGWKDPIHNHLEEHRTELEDLARRHYSTRQ